MVSELQGVAGWQLQGVIAEGENAVIYRAKRASAGEDEPLRALKYLRAGEDDESLGEAVEAFKERAEASRSIGHANIVGTIDLGVVDRRPFLVTELVEGVSLDLFPAKRSGRLKPEPALVVLVDLLEVLCAAVEQGLVHGRLDPGDLLIDEQGRVVLAGFGEEDSSQADFRTVAAIARELCASWPASVEDWIEGLEDGQSTFQTPSEALDAFPLNAFSRDAMEQGRKSLARAAKRMLAKREQPAGAPEDTPEDTPQGTDALDMIEPGDRRWVPREDRLSRLTHRIVETRAAQDAEALGSALTQAMRVAWLCAVLLVVGVAIEVVRFSG